ncbi:hypothetical protein ASU33_11935 [Solirubrum puertoriconensis]|uniref:HTH cro/C1-type domain-containing protein n=2 Tax=Solirubrum puertoriconensis TaxID=1751427 RepID=A0A9X0HMU7_SOLP1|nr:hypothetical protein ASU33_11935 [Solirubrum puertoriconensis]
MSKNAFALSLDKTATVIQHIVEERNKPGFDLLCKVFDVYPNVSKDWLMQGSGQMFNDETDVSDQHLDEASATQRISSAETKQSSAAPIATPIAQANMNAQTPTSAAGIPGSVAQSLQTQVVAEPTVQAASIAAPIASPAPTPVVASAAQVVSLESALYAQQLQHQLALAEMRNQHLQEQQKMLQQMVELMSKQLSR